MKTMFSFLIVLFFVANATSKIPNKAMPILERHLRRVEVAESKTKVTPKVNAAYTGYFYFESYGDSNCATTPEFSVGKIK